MIFLDVDNDDDKNLVNLEYIIYRYSLKLQNKIKSFR